MVLLLILSVIVLAFLGYLKYVKHILITSFHIKSIFLAGCVALFVVFLVIFPQVSLSAALQGLILWFNIVFPSLLPFVISSELLTGLGFVNFLGTLLEPFMRLLFNVPGAGSFAVAMGFTSGYPTGAKVTTMLRENGLCTKTEGERLLTFTNNSGPLFILSAVAIGMFGNPKLGFILAAAHYSAAVTVGILFRFYKRDKVTGGRFSCHQKKVTAEPSPCHLFKRAFREMFKTRRNDGRTFGQLMGDSVKNSVNLLLMVGGFIIFFSVLISILNQLNILSSLSSLLGIILAPFGIDNSLINSVLSGLFEVTTGSRYASLANADFIKKVVAEAFILGWAGLSIHFQVISIVSKTDMNILPYLLGKFSQGIIAAIYTFFSLKQFKILDSTQVFGHINTAQMTWGGYLRGSSELVIAGIVFLLLLGLVFKKT